MFYRSEFTPGRRLALVLFAAVYLGALAIVFAPRGYFTAPAAPAAAAER